MPNIGFWATAGGAGSAAGSYELISTTLISTNTALISFSAIPATYQHLQLRLVARTTYSSAVDTVVAQLNPSAEGSTGYWHHLSGDGTSVTSGGTSNAATQSKVARNAIAGNTAPASAFGVAILDILDYKSTTKNKTLRTLAGIANSAFSYINLVSSNRVTTAAISSIDLSSESSGSFMPGTRASLYGIKG